MLIASLLVAAPGGSPSYAQEKTFTYPNILPLSGPAALYGTTHKRAMDYAAADVNAEGGVVVGGERYKIVNEFLDNALDVAKAVEVVHKVVAQGNHQCSENPRKVFIAERCHFLLQDGRVCGDY